MTPEEIDAMFTYHPPKDDDQLKRYQMFRVIGRELARHIDFNCPDSREKSLAITSLQQTIMWANAAIAIHEHE